MNIEQVFFIFFHVYYYPVTVSPSLFRFWFHRKQFHLTSEKCHCFIPWCILRSHSFIQLYRWDLLFPTWTFHLESITCPLTHMNIPFIWIILSLHKAVEFIEGRGNLNFRVKLKVGYNITILYFWSSNCIQREFWEFYSRIAFYLSCLLTFQKTHFLLLLIFEILTLKNSAHWAVSYFIILDGTDHICKPVR